MRKKLLLPALALLVALASVAWVTTSATPPEGHIESNTLNVSTGHFQDGCALTSGTTSIGTIYGTAYSSATGAGASQAVADTCGIIYTIYECWDRNEDGQISQADEPIGETTLTAALTATTTTIPVASTATFLPTGYVLIDNELIKYYAVTGTALLTNAYTTSTTITGSYTVSGAGVSGANGTYSFIGAPTGIPLYVNSNGVFLYFQAAEYQTIVNLWFISLYDPIAFSGPNLYTYWYYQGNGSSLTGGPAAATWTTGAGSNSGGSIPTVTAGATIPLSSPIPGYPMRGMNGTTAAAHSAGATVTAVNAWDAVYTCVCNGTSGHTIGWNSSPLTSDNGTEGNLLQNGATIPVANGMHYLFKIRIVDGSGITNTEVSSADVFHTYGPPSYITAPPTGNTQGLANNAVLSLFVSEPPF